MRRMLQLVWVSYVYAFYVTAAERCTASGGIMVRNRGNRSSENITIQLQDWHPASGGHMRGANDYDLVGLDAASTNAPL